MRFPPVAKLLKLLLYLVFFGGVLLVITMPLLLDTYMLLLYDTYSLIPGYRMFIMFFNMVAGALGLWIIAELIAMLRTVEADPFVGRNVRALRRIGAASMVTALLFLGKCLLYVTPMTLVCGLLLVVCGLVAFTLADLFRQAVAFKEENDLTI